MTYLCIFLSPFVSHFLVKNVIKKFNDYKELPFPGASFTQHKEEVIPPHHPPETKLRMFLHTHSLSLCFTLSGFSGHLRSLFTLLAQHGAVL